MKTDLEIVDILYAKLDGSPVAMEITGEIYKHRRPEGAAGEHIVINCLAALNRQVQPAIANVNIYAPNISIDAATAQDSSLPDTVRLREMVDMAIDTLDDNTEDTYYFEVQQQQMIRDQETGEHYINIRVEFLIENL